MRLFTATLATETNTRVGFRTGMADFARGMLVRGGIEGQPPGLWATPALVWAARARARAWSLAEGPHTFAEPGGPVLRPVHEALRDEILAALTAAMPVDAVLLGLHGAMVAEGCDDCEGDLLARVRAIVGPRVPVGAMLDLHCHLTATMVEALDFLTIYRTYPHIDYGERAAELFDLLEAVIDRGARPVIAVADARAMGLFPTTRGTAMPALMREVDEVIATAGVLTAALAHGFPFADVPETGMKAVVVTDGDRGLAERLAAGLADRFRAVRGEAALAFVPMADAIDRALAAPAGPVVLADTADQVGGGAPGDATYLLEALLRRGAEGVGMAPFFDPMAVAQALAAGPGARLGLRVGGKLDRFSGAPVDLDVEVVGCFPDAAQDGLNGEREPIGDAALVRAGGIEILLTAQRTNVFTPSLLTRHGIAIGTRRILALKGLYRYWDRFAPLCAGMMLVATPGACCPDWPALDLRRVPRPIWPLDATA
jgi:microcystin degradation protein MlrC